MTWKFKNTFQGWLIPLIGIPIFILFGTYLLLRFFNFQNDLFNEADTSFYFFTAWTTVVLAFVAWINFKKFNELNEAQFLLSIDERWSSREIIAAREVIHKLYLRTQNQFEPENDAESKKKQRNQIGSLIVEISQDGTQIREFISLLNFLDFMETIGYLASKKYMPIEELNSLVGDSLIFNYEIFLQYIEKRQQKNHRFYIHFKCLYDEVKKIRGMEQSPQI
jgi:hypothetical protein